MRFVWLVIKGSLARTSIVLERIFRCAVSEEYFFTAREKAKKKLQTKVIWGIDAGRTRGPCAVDSALPPADHTPDSVGTDGVWRSFQLLRRVAFAWGTAFCNHQVSGEASLSFCGLGHQKLGASFLAASLCFRGSTFSIPRVGVRVLDVARGNLGVDLEKLVSKAFALECLLEVQPSS